MKHPKGWETDPLGFVEEARKSMKVAMRLLAKVEKYEEDDHLRSLAESAEGLIDEALEILESYD